MDSKREKNDEDQPDGNIGSKTKNTRKLDSMPAVDVANHPAAEDVLNDEHTPEPPGDKSPSEEQATSADKEKQDDNSDGRFLGWGRPVEARPTAVMPVPRDSDHYRMNHKRRGWAIIFVHEYFHLNLKPRECAKRDTELIKSALQHLNFEVKEYWDLGVADFHRTLEQVSKWNHQDSDCLVVVFMSHGDVEQRTNAEFLCTRNGRVETKELWTPFTANRCPKLAGKPKLFFIQACRGDEVDKGVQMRRPMKKGLPVQTDFTPARHQMHRSGFDNDYVIPLHADMLIMWASYPGQSKRMFAFKSSNYGIKGSVFIHFLAKVLKEDGKEKTLSPLLLRVTREVATLYESYSPDNNDLHQNKQTPYTVSTLMRTVRFP